MDREEIKSFLPHRAPMLLVDELTLDPDGTGHGRYRIRDDEFFCRGHLPENPVVPGVILCEIMAQTCSVLMLEDLRDHVPVYRGIDGVRFKQPVHPGDLCEISCRTLEKKGGLYSCAAELKVDGRLCCRGILTIAAVPDPKAL